MKILLIGASGTIGSAIATALGARHDLILASVQKSPEQVDISDAASIRALSTRVGGVDAVVSAAGRASFKPLTDLGDEDFELSLSNKLMGQVNLVRLGLASVVDGGSFTLTAGYLARHPIPGSGAVSLVNSGLEGFGRAAALEAPRGIRVNVVSPPWVTETLVKMGRAPDAGLAAATVAQAYVSSVEGTITGQTIDPSAAS